ncbi:MAG TPA: 2Fe-2S iron-sulfur cluster-binding protein [Myxococcota bacterium]|jgi:2Fe-2S ferredoxin
MTFKVTFLPLNKTVEAKDGWTVLDAALENDIDLEHACGGVAACSTCHVWVREGYESLEPASDKEEDMLDNAACLTTRSRLSCQVDVKRDLVVEIPPMSRNLVAEGKH